MVDRTSSIFDNRMGDRVVRKADRKKRGYVKDFGDDSARAFRLGAKPIPVLKGFDADQLVVGERFTDAIPIDLEADERALVVGTIRMGFGHYRMSMAIASAARARGLHPYWFDLLSFPETTGSKIIAKLNALYSAGSRLSQEFPPFNRLFWEPLNSEGFRKLAYNAVDQRVSELLATPCTLLPTRVPFVATHAWPAQAALHAGMERVVNVIPDNWPMALHLSEGAIHCVQSPSAWQGYKMLRGMLPGDTPRAMPLGSLHCTGHYIDHEIVSNLEADTRQRLRRLESGSTLRILLSVGGAGAQRELLHTLIERLLPAVDAGKVCLLVNVGDHEDALLDLSTGISCKSEVRVHSAWKETALFAEEGLGGEITGVHFFHHTDVFAAVYSTNLLMRGSDLLITKPSELAFYPIPKLHLRRVGGHEAWGAIHSAELGDGSLECSSPEEALSMLDLLLSDGEALALMNQCILSADRAAVYGGAYRAVDLATGPREQ